MTLNIFEPPVEEKEKDRLREEPREEDQALELGVPPALSYPTESPFVKEEDRLEGEKLKLKPTLNIFVPPDEETTLSILTPPKPSWGKQALQLGEGMLEGVKGFGEGAYQGLKEIPTTYWNAAQKIGSMWMKTGETLGQATVVLARFSIPGNEDLPDWKDLPTEKQAWVTAQTGAGLAALYVLAQYGVGVALNSARFLRLCNKVADRMDRMGMIKWKPSQVEKGATKVMESIGKAYKGKPGFQLPYTTIPESRIVSQPAFMISKSQATTLPASLDKYALKVMEVVAKEHQVTTAMARSLNIVSKQAVQNTLAKFTLPDVVPQAMLNQIYQELNISLQTGLNNLIRSQIVQGIKAPPKALANLEYLARWLEDTGLDRFSRNKIINVVRQGKGEIDLEEIAAVSLEFVDKVMSKKGYLLPGEYESYQDMRHYLPMRVEEALYKWRSLSEPKGEIETEEKFVILTWEQRQKIDDLKAKKHFGEKKFKKFMRLFTGRDSAGWMSKDEADILIKAMDSVMLTKAGKPILPETTDLLPAEFFNRKKRAVGLESWFVPAWRMFDFIGAKQEIYDPIEEAYVAMTGEVADKFELYKGLRKQIGGGAGTSRKLWEYLNGTLPQGISLTTKELTVAQKLRGILDDFADRLGLPPERRKANYIFHLFEVMTAREIAEKHPLPDELIANLEFTVPKHLFTPTMLHRLGREEGLRKDVWAAMRAVTTIDLRKIHLEPVLEQVEPYIKYYPATSQKYIQDWLDYTVLKHPAPVDELINVRLKPFDDFLMRITKGKVSLGPNISKTLGYLYTRLGYAGVMAFNLAVASKNLTQQLLIPPLLKNPLDFAGAWQDLFTLRGRSLLKSSQLLKRRFPMESFDPKDIGAWMRTGMKPYKFADWLNVSVSFLAGYREATAKGLPFEEAVKYADRLAKIAQYSYRPLDMPEFMWKGGAPGRAAGMLQTWSINYFGNYLPELTYRMMTGKDALGNEVSKLQRAGLLHHIALTTMFIYGMYKFAKVDFKKIFGAGVVPTHFSPTLNLVLGVGKIGLGFVKNDSSMKSEGWKEVKQTGVLFVPVGLQSKKLIEAYKKLAEGLERDRFGKVRRIVSTEEAIKGIFTYPAERSEYWRVQNRVWEIAREKEEIDRKLKDPTMSYAPKAKLVERLKKLAKESILYKRDLIRLRKGEPALSDKGFLKQMAEVWGYEIAPKPPDHSEILEEMRPSPLPRLLNE